MRELLDFMKAMGDETRIKIVALLSRHDMCVCELTEILGSSQSTVSQHLRILRGLRLVEDRKERQWVIYSINRPRLDELLARFGEFLDGPMGRSEDLAAEHKRFRELEEMGFRALCRAQAEAEAAG